MKNKPNPQNKPLKPSRIPLLALLPALLTGCGSLPTTETAYCDLAQTICIGDADKLTDQTAWQIERENSKIFMQCRGRNDCIDRAQK